MLEVADIKQLPVPQARAGEPAAWDSLFRRYQLPLYVYVFELVRNEQAALDLVQETFIASARHLGSLREDHKFGSWLFGIAHQQCIQHWRKSGREKLFDDDFLAEPIDGEPGPIEILVRAEQAAAFRKKLAQLPPTQCAALTLFFLEDFSLEEIADVTGAPLGTVKSRLHHAKRALKKLWEEQP